MAYALLSLTDEVEWRVKEYGRAEPLHLSIIMGEWLEDLFEPTGRYAVFIRNRTTNEHGPIEELLQAVVEDSPKEDLVFNLVSISHGLLTHSPSHEVIVGPRTWSPETVSMLADQTRKL